MPYLAIWGIHPQYERHHLYELTRRGIMVAMSPLLLCLTCFAGQSSDPIAPFEGVWSTADGRFLFAGNGRMDWKTEDRYYTAKMSPVPDGTLLGSYLAGKEISVSLDRPETAASTPSWGTGVARSYRGRDGLVYIDVPHVGPDPATFARPVGEARLTVKAFNGRGQPAVIIMATTPVGSRTPDVSTFVRTLPMDRLTLAGSFADKDLTVTWDGESGRVGTLRGSLTYLGKKYSVAGRRVMGRAAFNLYDDSRRGVKGVGYTVSAPSPDRTSLLVNRDSDVTDQIDVAFGLEDGSTARGIHKTLKRSP